MEGNCNYTEIKELLAACTGDTNSWTIRDTLQEVEIYNKNSNPQKQIVSDRSLKSRDQRSIIIAKGEQWARGRDIF